MLTFTVSDLCEKLATTLKLLFTFFFPIQAKNFLYKKVSVICWQKLIRVSICSAMLMLILWHFSIVTTFRLKCVCVCVCWLTNSIKETSTLVCEIFNIKWCHSTQAGEKPNLLDVFPQPTRKHCTQFMLWLRGIMQ